LAIYEAEGKNYLLTWNIEKKNYLIFKQDIKSEIIGLEIIIPSTKH